MRSNITHGLTLLQEIVSLCPSACQYKTLRDLSLFQAPLLSRPELKPWSHRLLITDSADLSPSRRLAEPGSLRLRAFSHWTNADLAFSSRGHLPALGHWASLSAVPDVLRRPSPWRFPRVSRHNFLSVLNVTYLVDLRVSPRSSAFFWVIFSSNSLWNILWPLSEVQWFWTKWIQVNWIPVWVICFHEVLYFCASWITLIFGLFNKSSHQFSKREFIFLFA